MADQPDLATLTHWFDRHWRDRQAAIPTRLHVHEVEPDSRLGSPKLSPKFLAHIAASANDVEVITETRRCNHVRLPRDFHPADVFACPDCAGGGYYEATRVLYRDPLASALDSLHRHPGSWPRGLLAPDRLILELVARRYSIPALALDLVMREVVCAEFARLALARLHGRFREGPPTRIGWTEKSAAQQAAETAA